MNQTDPLFERFEALADRTADSDWAEVRRRAGLRARSPLVLAVTAVVSAVVLLAVPAIGLGVSGVLPFFQGKRAPDRVVKIFADLHHGYPDGMDPGVIEGQTRQVLDVNVPDAGRAVLWVAPTHGGGFCDLLEMGSTSGGGCAEPPVGLNPTIWFGSSMSPPSAVMTGVTGVHDAATVEVEFADGKSEVIPLVWVSKPIDAAFFVYGIPRTHWQTGHDPHAIVLRAGNGRELAHKAFRFTLPRRLRNAPSPPYHSANEHPLQHEAVFGSEVDVYPSGLVHVRFKRVDSGPYAFLLPKVHAGGRPTVTIECGRVSFRRGAWRTRLGGTYANFGRVLDAVVSTPSPPFDACSVRGHYGRRWDEHVGYHNAVEFPFDQTAKRFFAEQATARRLAYFVRSAKLRAIRRALKNGGTAPASSSIASRFDESVVALSSRAATPPPGKVGVWSDSAHTIVATEQAADGRRLWVELNGGRLGPNNLHGLAFVF